MSRLFVGCVSVAVLSVLAGPALIHAAPTGIVVGHLSIVAHEEVELADEKAPAVATFARYPLVILGKDEKEVTRVTADAKGDYRVVLPPGDYVLDAQGRTRRHLRAKPQPFTVISNQTVRVDLTIDPGVR